MRKKILVAAILVIGISAFAAAQATTIDTTFFEDKPGNTYTEGDLSAFLNRFYQFGLGIAGVGAVGMIVIGAIYISISAGSPDKQNEGKEMISSALWGMLLLFGSYLILNTVNPRITTLRDPALKNPWPSEGYTAFRPNDSCSAAAIAGKSCDGEEAEDLMECLNEQNTFFIKNTNDCNKKFSRGGGYFFRSDMPETPQCAPWYIDDCLGNSACGESSTKEKIDAIKRNLNAPDYMNNPPFGNSKWRFC